MSRHDPAAEAVVDLDAYAHNLSVLGEAARGARMMAVLKADAYGHGLVECARTARANSVSWLGVTTIAEALELREVADEGRILCWLYPPGADFASAVEHDIDLAASSAAQLGEIVAAAAGRRARVHLKVDTGMSRNGALGADWSHLVTAAATAQRKGAIEVVGVWSHLACADEPTHPSVAAQEQVFREAVVELASAGIEPELRHLANSAATLTRPSAHFDLVRVGIASYGLTPAPNVASSSEYGLRPAMTLRARLAHVKRVPAGSGVSYGHTHVTSADTTLGLVPVGYGDGVLRALSNRASVWCAGDRRPIVGRVCMDQFMIDLGDTEIEVGEPVTLFGAGAEGDPTAQDWADAADTISYEVVTRIGGRIERRHLGARA
ncbi:alanine racemase [Solicola gregarius]|uniref:Alanine racemase n=1 Tax=Solicola gregarius TaxID=2908642 RepID=A0AA46TFC2_9ACTN|nr:alanine racemase [Solicola gregarius]UYM03829.1 alanine racemase [Solicola gregarius]